MEAAPAAQAETIGMTGLLFSLLAIAALTAVYVGLVAGVVLGLDTLLFGRGHFLTLLASVDPLAGSGAPRQMKMATIAFGCLVYAALTAAILTLTRLTAGRDWPQALAWRTFRFTRMYVLLVVAGCLWGLAASAVVEHLHPAARDWFRLPVTPLPLAGTFLMIVVLAPLAEELLFRGCLFTHLRARFGFYPAWLGSSLLFALAHWEGTHLYAAAVFPVGLALGWVRETTGSTRASALFHGFYNLMGWVLTFAEIG